MKSDAGKNDSIWTITADLAPRPPIAADDHASVVVVGAGIAGLTVAYVAAKEGKSVIVLDDGPVGGGESGRTTAHLSNALDDRYFKLERLHGERGARLAAASHTAAIDKIEEIVMAERIECEFTRLDGYLFLSPGEDDEYLSQELDAAHRAGLSDVKLVDRAPLRDANTGAALRFPRQGQFHPMKYLAGLADAIERMGGKIFTRSHVEDLVRGEKPAVKVAGGLTVRGNFIVFATNTPVNDWITIHTKQEAYRTYVIGALVPKGSIPPMLLWDTEDPYHYVRLQSLSEEHDVLIIGGEDHKTGQGGHNTEACFDRLESWARGLFRNIEFVEFRWSGQIMEPVDSLAFIGLNPGDENIFIATGDSGHGMTHGTIAGMLINDLMDGARTDWARLYDPSRKTVRAAGEFARANLNVARQYFDFLTGGDVKDADQIAPGSGAVLRRGLQKVAAYRDDAGQLHELSAICPHLGCIVDWNDTEKTWDCPCHGSRFSSDGSVVNGPANTGLSPTEDDDDPVETIPAVQ